MDGGKNSAIEKSKAFAIVGIVDLDPGQPGVLVDSRTLCGIVSFEVVSLLDAVDGNFRVGQFRLPNRPLNHPVAHRHRKLATGEFEVVLLANLAIEGHHDADIKSLGMKGLT